jgi:hypothetical protein
MQDWLQRLQDFASTEDGRWALLSLAGAAVVLVILLVAFRRWRAAHGKVPSVDLLEDLATYPPAPPLPPSARPLVLYGLPVRVRLVVIGPLGLEAGSVAAEEANDLLDLAVPGLGQRLQLDLPRVRLWPTQLSHQGFVAAFRRNTQLPEGDARLRRWVLVMGKVLRNGSPIAVGLALQSTEPNTLGPVVLNYAHQWMEVLRFAGTT